MNEIYKIRKTDGLLFKDEILDHLAGQANVAQFVSFAPNPDLPQRFCQIRGHSANHGFEESRTAVATLLQNTPDGAVNIRSYRPEQPKGGEFLYGLTDVDVVMANLHRLAISGFHTIVNETVDVMDGGVSGVVVDGLIEFAPRDTPRCVEKPGTCRFSRDMGVDVLRRVYGFRPALDYPPNLRVEFSLHPLCRGVRHEHTIIWEIEDVGGTYPLAEVVWPNRFSRLLGDKAFGLLVADALNLPVPRTTVISRAVAPFAFGRSTGTSEVWIRTCPATQEPGRFTTHHGWIDPFKLLNQEDPDDDRSVAQHEFRIASILAQEGVNAIFSGALISSDDGTVVVEGVAGQGDRFMIGAVGPQPLPDDVYSAVLKLFDKTREYLGAVRMEWVHDGTAVWIVQLHKGPATTMADAIVLGQSVSFREFDVKEGLEALRAIIPQVQKNGTGIVLIGDVGITSHFGDVLRRAEIPSRIVRR